MRIVSLSDPRISGKKKQQPRDSTEEKAMNLLRLALTCLCAIAFAISLRAQAAVEYAAKSAGATLENTAAGIHFGVCPLDSALVHCVHYRYPVTFYVALVVICFIFAKLLFPKRRA
jgi:hypothetical protein